MKKHNIKEINDSNDMLGYILDIQDENGNFNVNTIIDFMGVVRKDDTEKYLADLIDDGYIIRNDFVYFHVYPHSRKAYVTKTQKVWIKISPSLFAFSGWLLGIATDDIKEFIHAVFSLITKKICGN